MHDFIFILGAQGSGKTTLARILKEKLNSVHIDYDWIRDFHLDKNWKNANDAEGKMSLENLVFLLKNYAKHNYKDVIVTGFIEKDFKIILNELKDYKSIIVTLILSNDDVLKQRVLTESRDSGFRDFGQSIQFNKRLRDELHFPNEHKIDNTNKTPEETAIQVIGLLAKC